MPLTILNRWSVLHPLQPSEGSGIRRLSPAIIRLLKDKEVEVRIGAAVVLGRLGDRKAAEPLKFLLKDPFSDVREAAETALLRLGK